MKTRGIYKEKKMKIHTCNQVQLYPAISEDGKLISRVL